MGWSYFDSNVADGPPIVRCWWHHYWGYVCDGYYNTFSGTTYTYGAGIGASYRLAGDSFLKLSYNVRELDGIGAARSRNLSGARLE